MLTEAQIGKIALETPTLQSGGLSRPRRIRLPGHRSIRTDMSRQTVPRPCPAPGRPPSPSVRWSRCNLPGVAVPRVPGACWRPPGVERATAMPQRVE